jgi:hypothetical protein
LKTHRAFTDRDCVRFANRPGPTPVAARAEPHTDRHHRHTGNEHGGKRFVEHQHRQRGCDRWFHERDGYGSAETEFTQPEPPQQLGDRQLRHPECNNRRNGTSRCESVVSRDDGDRERSTAPSPNTDAIAEPYGRSTIGRWAAHRTQCDTSNGSTSATHISAGDDDA